MHIDAGKFHKSVGFALKGLTLAFRNQQNLWIHAGVACIVVAAGIFADLNPTEWCLAVLAIALVLALELMNSAVEKLVDFVSPEYHAQAGAVKDIAAGAVLLAAIGAVIVGVILFLPKVI